MHGLCAYARLTRPAVTPHSEKESSSSAEPSARASVEQHHDQRLPAASEESSLCPGELSTLPKPSNASTSNHEAIIIIQDDNVLNCDRQARAPTYFTKQGLLLSAKRHLLFMQDRLGIQPSVAQSPSSASTHDDNRQSAEQPSHWNESHRMSEQDVKHDNIYDKTFVSRQHRDHQTESVAGCDASSPTPRWQSRARKQRRRTLNAHTHYSLIKAICADDTDWAEPAQLRIALEKLARENELWYSPKFLGGETRHDASSLQRSCANFILLGKAPEIGENEYTREDLWELRLRQDYLIELGQILGLELRYPFPNRDITN
ncbi:hypothetical protein LTR81_025964 [Elasticomyces elasticus]